MRKAWLVLLSFAALGWMAPAARLHAQDGRRNDVPDVARIKQEEARRKMARLERDMQRLARLLRRLEPYNAAKLERAFRASREHLLVGGMDRVIEYLEKKQISRALEEQKEITVNLDELLAILLQDDLDPREILRQIRRMRDVLTDLDTIVKEETREKIASTDAERAGKASASLARDLAKLENLIRREKELESAARDSERLQKKGGELARKQEEIRNETGKLRAGEAEGGEGRKSGDRPGAPAGGDPARADGGSGKAGGGSGKAGGGSARAGGGSGKAGGGSGKAGGGSGKAGGGSGETGAEGQPRPPVLNPDALRAAEGAMRAAEGSLRQSDAGGARKSTTEARTKLEDAAGSGKERLQRLRRRRNFKKMKKDQDATQGKTEALLGKMREPVPLLPAEGGMPGTKGVEGASSDMGEASGSLGQGRAKQAATQQDRALRKLRQSRKEVEDGLRKLQEALRERMLAYLRQKFQDMLEKQRRITRDTRRLHLRILALKAVKDKQPGSSLAGNSTRQDRQQAELLAAREERLAMITDDVRDLLDEDGTTIVFKQIVGELRSDLMQTHDRLTKLQAGKTTQFLQKQIIETIQEILKALEESAKKPPPPNPNQGRKSKSGAGPLLPLSAELRMVRSLQKRVNERTEIFDSRRSPGDELAPDDKLELDALARKQKEIERLLRKLAKAVRE